MSNCSWCFFCLSRPEVLCYMKVLLFEEPFEGFKGIRYWKLFKLKRDL